MNVSYLAEVAYRLLIGKCTKTRRFIELDQDSGKPPGRCAIVLGCTAFVFVALSSLICLIIWLHGWLQVVSLASSVVWIQKIPVRNIALLAPTMRNRCASHHISVLVLSVCYLNVRRLVLFARQSTNNKLIYHKQISVSAAHAHGASTAAAGKVSQDSAS